MIANDCLSKRKTNTRRPWRSTATNTNWCRASKMTAVNSKSSSSSRTYLILLCIPLLYITSTEARRIYLIQRDYGGYLPRDGAYAVLRSNSKNDCSRRCISNNRCKCLFYANQNCYMMNHYPSQADELVPEESAVFVEPKKRK